MKTLRKYLRPYWKYLVLALILASVNQIFSLLDPFIVSQMINKFAKNYANYTQEEFINGIVFFVSLAIGAAMVSRIAKNFQDYFVNVITQKVGTDIYTTGIKQSLALPYIDFEDQRSGETLGRLQKVKTDSERVISSFINIIFTSIVGVGFVLFYAITVYWPVAIFYLCTIPIIAILSSLLSKRIKRVQKSIVSETTRLAGSTTESLRNIELVKSLGLTQQEISRLNNNTNEILKLELKKVKYIRTLSFIQGTTINLLRNCVVVLLMFLIFKEKISLGDYFALFMYSFFIFNPLQELGNIIQLYRESEVSLNQFEALMQQETEKKPEKITPIGKISSLEFDHVTFKHKSSNRNALDDVSFKVNKGQSVAFVGPSGSGKTTLVKLLVGLYRPKQGTIRYNGVDAGQIDYEELRSQLGFVMQDTQLFSGTLKENLLFVKPDATDEECLRALEKAACQNLLNRTDKGLNTVIGEGGLKLSGGEKQRVSIARALLRNPGLLVFDEATSALDSLTEEEISETIRQLSKGDQHISVLIAHRLSTIMHADTIIVLEKGKIIEQGTHEELVNLKGLYHAMWRQQAGEVNS